MVSTCKCCPSKPKNFPHYRGMTFNNRLTNEAREWAKEHGFRTVEVCYKAVGRRKLSSEEWQRVKCGDGGHGFATRKRPPDYVFITETDDGGHKKGVKTIVRPKSARSTTSRHPRRIDGSKTGLVSNSQLSELSRDEHAVQMMNRLAEKTKRAKNRNHRARRHMRKGRSV